MTKIRGAATAALVTLIALSLTDCSGGSSGSAAPNTTTLNGSPSPGSPQYCADAKSAITQLRNLGSGKTFTSSTFEALTGAVHTVVSEAPGDIVSSWTLIEQQFAFLKTTLDKAGVSIEDFAQIAQGKTPADVDPATIVALNASLKKYDIASLNTAHAKILSELKAICGLTPTPTPT